MIRLRQELAATREYLQSVIEQQEAANEELQSANEEVQSTNEELQSINEELETSREEIQSSSEEIATVNDELNNRNQELSRINNDLINLITSVQVPIVMLGPDFRIRRFTQSAERLLNLIAADIGRRITDIKPNLELPDLAEQLAEVMETVTPREQSIKDKHGRWYSLRLRPYRTIDNKIDGVVLMLMDIQALKEAEETMRAVGDRLAVLHDQAPLGIRDIDTDGRYTQVNQKYCLITGYTREELIGRRFEEFVLAEDRRRVLEGFRRVMTGAIPFYREEYQHLHKSGRPIWVEVHGFALRDHTGKSLSGVAFLQDVSERKQADQELRQADRVKNEFLAMLAHELRNPLAPMLNAAHLLATPNVTPEGIASLRSVLERQIRNLSRMTDDLLDISRISRGRIRLHPEIVDLTALSRRALELFRPVLESRGQVLQVELPAEEVYLEADPVRLEQIIDNLLGNASKFTERDGEIRFTLRRLPDPAPGMAELVVRDTGRGIPGDLLPTVFEPFVQAEQTLDRTRGGLGIGLTLVRHLVQLHHGVVEARSEGIGKGAEFVVRLPIVPGPVGVLPERRKPANEHRSRRILIVDDNPDAADTLGMLLRHQGHEVSIASEGEAAVRIAGYFDPEIVLLDIGLPGRDGIEVARDLKAQAGSRHLHIVAVSGYGQEDLRRRARGAGIEHYFTKPVDIASLVRLFSGLS